MGWPSSLTYREIAARNVKRSVGILACYGDVETAAALFASDPALADDPDALASAAGSGDEAFVNLMLRYQPDLARRIAVVAKTRELTELLFRHGMDPNRPNWLGITRLHEFAEQGAIESAAIFIDHGADLHARDEELSLDAARVRGQVRQGPHGRVPPPARRQAEPPGRSAVGDAAGMGDASRAPCDRSVVDGARVGLGEC